MDMFKKVAFVVLWSIIGITVFMLATWAIFWVNGNNLVQDRLADLVVIVSEENCLANDGTNTALGMYEDLLEASETDWLKFKTNKGDSVPLTNKAELAYFVGNNAESKSYYSYIDAPQKGSIIKVKVTGELNLPLFFNPSGSGSITLKIPITKTYVTLGLKYFKDK